MLNTIKVYVYACNALKIYNFSIVSKVFVTPKHYSPPTPICCFVVVNFILRSPITTKPQVMSKWASKQPLNSEGLSSHWIRQGESPLIIQCSFFCKSNSGESLVLSILEHPLLANTIPYVDFFQKFQMLFMTNSFVFYFQIDHTISTAVLEI